MIRAIRLLLVIAVLVLAGAPASLARPQEQAPAADAAGQAEAAPGGAPGGAPGDTIGDAPGAETDAEGEAAAGGEDGGATTETGGAVAPDREAMDIDALRQEYLRLRDQLFRSRARAAAVASALYSTRMRIHLDYETARFYTITQSSIRLDGASVFEDESGAIGADRAVRFEGYVAPGRHRIGVRIEATGKDDERFTTVVDNAFTLQAPAGKDVIVRIRARDAGDIAYAWEKQQKGAYKLQLDVRVETVARKADAKGEQARAPGAARRRATAQARRGR